MIVPLPPKKPTTPDAPIVVQCSASTPPASDKPLVEDWHAKVLAAIDMRFEYLQAIEAAGEPAKKLEMEVCAADPVYWINNWVWTYDPRELDLPTRPFVLWPKQEELVRWIQAREAAQEGGLVEKSRDWGVTWICVAYAVHGWLFRSGYAVGFGSRKELYVDQLGNPDSILEKARILIDALPAWMKPKGYKREQHAGFCKILNPENDASITGEAGDNIGRGGRRSIFFPDEAAFMERAHLIERSLSQTTRVQIDVSTPNGMGNPFAKKRFSGTVPVFTASWTDDPRKSPAWLEEQKKKYDAVTVAQEILIDYSASVEGVCIPSAWVRAAVELERYAEFPKGGWAPTCAGLDIAEEGNDLSVWTPRFGPLIGEPVSWSGQLTTETAYRARDLTEQQKMPVLMYDAPGVGAGVRGILMRTDEKLAFRPVAVNTGAAASDTRWPDGKTSKERFANLKAELWWMLRARFEKTYEFRELGIKHPPEDMISIPNHQELIKELSLPLAERTETGKVRIESKKAMRARGITKSPDFADSLALTMLPVPRKVGIW